MKQAKNIILTGTIYSIVIGLIMIALSTLSFFAYNCFFNWESSPAIYMLKTLYYRAESCESFINWQVLGVRNHSNFQPAMPVETFVVFQTFIFTISYMAMNVLLVITAILAISGLKDSKKGRISIFSTYFAPWIMISLGCTVLDIIATVTYVQHNIKSASVDGLMSLMEIRNTWQIAPFIEQISIDVKTIPSLIMFLTAAKCFLFLAIHIAVMISIVPAGWKFTKECQILQISPVYGQENAAYNNEIHELTEETVNFPQSLHIPRVNSQNNGDK